MTDRDSPPADALRSARRALDAWAPEQARAILRPALAARPDWAEARFHLARADAALGDAEAARAGFELALAAAPKEPSVWMEFALFAHGSGTAKDVLRRARQADLPQALTKMIAAAASGLGARAVGTGAATRRDLAAMAAKVKSGDAKGVETLAAPLLRRQPGASVWGLLGEARLAARAADPAAEAFRQGLRLEPYAADLRLGLVRALGRGGHGPAALAEARRLASQAPAWPEAQVAFARLALSHGLTTHADRAARAALSSAPRSDAALSLAAETALAIGRPGEALEIAARRKGDAAGAALQSGRAAAAAKQSDAALSHYARAIDQRPDDAEPRVARAALLQSLGRAEEAEADLDAVLARRPGHGAAARALAYGRRLDPSEPVVRDMRIALADGRTAADDRRLLHYALGRVFERSDPATSFAHLTLANAANAAAWPHDPEADRVELARITGPVWDTLRDAPATSTCNAAPIFVTGLPRSGTTLIEAILSAHGEVRAGGEMAALQPALADLSRDLAAGRAPDAATLTGTGDAYAAAADALSGGPDPRRLTDKSIHTFVRIGLAARILPAARVVVVHRDPRDTGLSIWRNHFRDGAHRYANSFEGIADHIALFRDAVAFWRDALPAGAFHDIRYEALLDDPEGEARRLLDACDLDWDPGVLSFHERAERVDTLSFAQVRQPLYRSSRGGWRAHADHIAPLIDALAARNLLPDEAEADT